MRLVKRFFKAIVCPYQYCCRKGAAVCAKFLFALFFFFQWSPVIAATSKIVFAQSGLPGKRIVIAAVGDILMHQSLQEKAARYGFESLWRQAIPYFKRADIVYGNLEGPVAQGVSKTGRLIKDPGHRFDNNVYSSFPRFNVHPNLVLALKKSGFNVLSFANNHSLDRFGVGVDRTIENLKRGGLQTVGAKKKSTSSPWYTIIRKNGFVIAWIACAQDTNGIKDHGKQILYCYKKQDQKIIFQNINRLKNKVDAIIVSPHWGVQYKQQPTSKQVRFAKQLLNAGALAIIGSHPHCLQPMKKYITRDGRETFIAYSLGNFVSYQGTPKNRATVILYLGLRKTKQGSAIDFIRYVPAYMQNRSGEKKLYLKILSARDRHSVGQRIIKKVLPSGNAFVAESIDPESSPR